MAFGGGAQPLCGRRLYMLGRNQLGDGDTANSFCMYVFLSLYFAWHSVLVQFIMSTMICLSRGSSVYPCEHP